MNILKNVIIKKKIIMKKSFYIFMWNLFKLQIWMLNTKAILMNGNQTQR